MSASLVGSEMCIRDSHAPGFAEPRGPFCLQLGAGSVRCAKPGSWAPAPVSYTHLTLPTICSV
eukprot:9694066-Alexandrium_andersonii.AAC.1